MHRTHTCGELRKENEGETVTLAGWVHKIRTHGSLVFLDLRDRYGITQVTITQKPETLPTKESVIQVEGEVTVKPEPNKALATGDVEIKAENYTMLSEAKPLPLDLNNEETTEETRLKYRYLDLRTKRMRDNIEIRHRTTKAVRDYLDKHQFLEIETPVLGKSTPEGARDYLVPSRVNQGKFFALPQSPQIFKQLFQISGLDRYMQIVKCFRDEDLRADRQPEFTQIDLEMSFVDEEDIYGLMEGMIKHVWKEVLGKEITTPFSRMTYHEAMLKYGSDKPDLRFDLPITDVTAWAKETNFKIFRNAACVRAIRINGAFSRKEIDAFTEKVKIYGAKGLAWLKQENGELAGAIAKFVEKPPMELEEGDHLFFVADDEHTVAESLGALRLHLGEECSLIDKKQWRFVWITDFPLLEWSEEDQRYVAMHHPFTSPRHDQLDKLKTNPKEVMARAYDLTLNGFELGGGSIRIHDKKLQEDVFTALGVNDKEQQEKFGFMINAFQYGAPPHGGIAFGLDRMVMLLAGMPNIREVIAFPKNKDAEDLMLKAPSEVSKTQLEELGIKTK
ncbi:MAG: aspartate--tRNA ligase [Candidatus Woesearchaeota archaeon]